MLCIANMKVPPVKLAPNQKVKTWKFAAKYLWKERFTEDKAELGRWTRDELLELGPTFVKLGQIASTRGDLYPPEFTKELESLQDNVPPFDFNLVKDVVNKIYSKILMRFHSNLRVLDRSQSHLKNGKKVVVKLKRPGILDIMKSDTKMSRRYWTLFSQ